MTDITGRDGYIVAKALAYAIEAIDQLPEERREEGDQADMKRLLDQMVSSDRRLAELVRGVRAHMTGEGWEL